MIEHIIVDGFVRYLGLSQIMLTSIGVFVGILVGVLPGVGPMLGVILMTPIAILLDPVAGMSLLIGIYVGGSCGGAISAILLRIPGTPMAAATLLDGYPMAQKGEAPKAVGLSIAASSLGGLLGGIGLMFISPFLAQVALKFGPPEYFALALVGLLSIAVIARESTLKGLLSACFGLFLATVGTDPINGEERFTMGSDNLMGGIGLVALLVGLFAVSEMLIQLEKGKLDIKPDIKVFRAPFSVVMLVLKRFINLLRSSFIGTFIGSLPAVGGVAASFISYAVAKAASRTPDEFGKGSAEGVVASEASNNAVCGGALIPAFALAIPGDPITAVLLGAMILVGLLPGPTLFSNYPDVVGGIFYAYIGSSILLLFIGILFTPIFVSIIKLRKNRLIPIIVLLSIVGTFSVQSSMFDIWCMWIFGIIGYGMRKLNFPLAPLVIARVLSPVIEPAFRRSLILSGGSFSIFVSRPICLFILILAAMLLIWTVIPKKFWQDIKMKLSTG